MPLTPFHFGPGALAKAVAPRHFSLRAFVLSQVVIDCETAWNLYRGNKRLHTFFHSYLGALIAMALTAIVLVGWNRYAFRSSKSWFVRELEDWGKLFEFRSSSIAILFGGWSHVLLDSVMHADMWPLSVFLNSNMMLNSVSLETLHMACLWSFVGAGLIWVIRISFRNLQPTFRSSGASLCSPEPLLISPA